MNRLSPLTKGGLVGVLLAFLFNGTSIPQNHSNTTYRLEKNRVVPCNFEAAFPSVKALGTDEAEFRVSRNGDFYFIFYEKAKLCRLDSSGKLIRSVSTVTLLNRRSSGLALSPEGDVFILDGRGKRLYRYDASLDLIGNYLLGSKDELEPVFGLAATSWGDLFVSGGLKSTLWKLEPEGQGFSAKPLYLQESYRYFHPAEEEGGRLVATDPLGALLVLDRYGNLLRSFNFRKGLRAYPTDGNYLVTFWPYTELMVLDTVGVVLANWKTAELDSVLKNVVDFQVVQNRVYFLLPALNEILVFRLDRLDSTPLPEGAALKK